MSPRNIINLSLSTDDEASAVKLPVVKAVLPRSTPRPTPDFIPFLSDDFDTSLLLNEPHPK